MSNLLATMMIIRDWRIGGCSWWCRGRLWRGLRLRLWNNRRLSGSGLGGTGLLWARSGRRSWRRWRRVDLVSWAGGAGREEVEGGRVVDVDCLGRSGVEEEGEVSDCEEEKENVSAEHD